MEKELTKREKVLDWAEFYTRMIKSSRKHLVHTQYVVDHPDKYDDVVVDLCRFRLPGCKEDLAYWRARRQTLCRDYPDIIPRRFDDRVS